MLKKTFKPSLIVVTELEQRRNGSSHVVPAAANDRLATRIVRWTEAKVSFRLSFDVVKISFSSKENKTENIWNF